MSKTPPTPPDGPAEQTPTNTGLQAIRTFINSEGIAKKFEQLLGRKSQGFITSVLQIVSSNKDLSACDPASVYNAAATAAILDLPLNNNLQFAHLIPYKDNKQGGKLVAQFQVGWRGFVQLAQRSGKFSTINVCDVREGELKKRDRMTGECVFEWEQDDDKRQTLKVIGFVAYFRLINGFEKALYRTLAELKAHGKKYSKTYDRSDGKWNTDFEAMCAKTLIKEILNKWAPLSIEMAQSIQADQGIIKGIEGGEIQAEYWDNPIEDIDEAEAERIRREAQAKNATDNLQQNLGLKDDVK